MSVAVMQSSAFYLSQRSWLAPETRIRCDDVDRLRSLAAEDRDEVRPGGLDIWSGIQSQKPAVVVQAPAAPYVHPLAKRASSMLSQKSLEVCTESLGSETGSDDFFYMDDLGHYYPPKFEDEEREEEECFPIAATQVAGLISPRGKELTTVNYPSSISRRLPTKSFPPPLSSISRRNGPCIHMQPYLRDGRLVVEAIPVPSQNYLHARRVDGRLLLSFIETNCGNEPSYESDDVSDVNTIITILPRGQEGIVLKENIIEEKIEEELGEGKYFGGEELDVNCYEEEELEVVARGIMVELKVSTQPQQHSGAMKMYRALLVIDKFVVGMPHNGWARCGQPMEEDDNISYPNKQDFTIASTLSSRLASNTSTTAAAAAAASTLGVAAECYTDGWLSSALVYEHPPVDNKLLFTSRLRNRPAIIHMEASLYCYFLLRLARATRLLSHRSLAGHLSYLSLQSSIPPVSCYSLTKLVNSYNDDCCWSN